jgi:hypothetical protein
MNASQAPDNSVIIDMDMACQIGRINHDNIISQLTIVGNMAVGHDEVIISDDGHTYIGSGTPVYGNKFSNCIIVSNDDPLFFSFKFQILRNGTD